MTMQTTHGDGCGSLSVMAKLTQVQHILSSKWNISKQGCHTIVDAIVNNNKY